MTTRLLLPCVVALLLAGCHRVGESQARDLVLRYNQAVSEAYRRCDLLLIDSVVAPNCVAGRNLTGLIGVRTDMGIALDARILDLVVTGVAVQGDRLEVRTRERWTYQDRRIGTGQVVGETSEDRYELLYRFQRIQGNWMVTETQFTTPPHVGRKTTPWQMDAREAHAMTGPATEAKP